MWSTDDEIRSNMQLALEQAEEAFDALEVPIGCVFYDPLQKVVITSGRNRTNELKNGTQHAELVALAAMNPEAARHDTDWSRMELFVTVEPCIMCAAALRNLGIGRVYFGCHNERFGGCGSVLPVHQSFMPAGIPELSIIPLLEKWRRPCVEILRRFYLRENERAPQPKRKANRIFKPVQDPQP